MQVQMKGITKGGRSWTPKFVESIDEEKCIGCGRCFKVCGRGILELQGLDDDGQHLSLSEGSDEEIEKKVMVIVNGDLCVGCEACAKVCPKKCYTHNELPG